MTHTCPSCGTHVACLTECEADVLDSLARIPSTVECLVDDTGRESRTIRRALHVLLDRGLADHSPRSNGPYVWSITPAGRAQLTTVDRDALLRDVAALLEGWEPHRVPTATGSRVAAVLTGDLIDLAQVQQRLDVALRGKCG